MHPYSRSPNEWGSHYWYVIFSSAYNLPRDASPECLADFRQLLISFKSILPCGACRKNYRSLIETEPFATSLSHGGIRCRDDAIKLTHAIREEVRKHETASTSRVFYNHTTQLMIVTFVIIAVVAAVSPHVPKRLPMSGRRPY